MRVSRTVLQGAGGEVSLVYSPDILKIEHEWLMNSIKGLINFLMNYNSYFYTEERQKYQTVIEEKEVLLESIIEKREKEKTKQLETEKNITWKN